MKASQIGQPVTVVPINRKLIKGLYGGLERSHALQVLSELQVPFPATLPDVDAAHTFPTDVTKCSPNQLRELLSYWTSQFARINALLGLAKGREKILERRTEREKLIQFNIRAPSQKSRSFSDAIKGEIQQSRGVAILEKNLDHAHELVFVLAALSKDFDMYCQVLNSELMYRMSEMKSIRGN
jgi:hypothetical protein